MARQRFYVGLASGDGSYELFKSAVEPTEETHGEKYGATIGPFRTKRGAEFMRDYGRNNPHVRCVADAERLAKLDAEGEPVMKVQNCS